MKIFKLTLIFVLTSSYLSLRAQDFLEDDVNMSTPELLTLRGYIAEEHKITTTDGYILELIRGINPLVNKGRGALHNKEVVLCIHGILTNTNLFMINSKGFQPADYSALNASRLTQNQLEKLLEKDDYRNAIALEVLNFGHEIWLLNRRGVMGSIERVAGGSAISELEKSPDSMRDEHQDHLSAPNYYNFTLDEQAKYDIPETIDYIRKLVKRRKISIIAHSAGGALTLMALAHRPELAQKLSKSILYSPAFGVGGQIIEFVYDHIFPMARGYIGPVPHPSFVPMIRKSFSRICSDPFWRFTMCRSILVATSGQNSMQQEAFSEYMNGIQSPISSLEFAQLEQSLRFKTMHYFDYGSRKKNQRIYGQPIPPAYNISGIRFKGLTLWASEKDGLVSTEDVKRLHDSLTVPNNFRNETGEKNHFSYFLDKDTYKFYVIPTLQILDS